MPSQIQRRQDATTSCIIPNSKAHQKILPRYYFKVTRGYINHGSSSPYRIEYPFGLHSSSCTNVMAAGRNHKISACAQRTQAPPPVLGGNSLLNLHPCHDTSLHHYFKGIEGITTTLASPAGVQGDSCAESVKILVFPSPTSDML